MRISNPKDMGGNKLLHRVNVATGGVIEGEGTEANPLTANVEAIASNVFPAFSGNSGKVLRVNANETGTEWVAMQSGGSSSTPDISSLKVVRTISSEDAFEALAQEVKDSLKEIAFLATPGTAEPLNWSAQDGYVRPGHAYLLLPFQWKYSYAVRWKHFVVTGRCWKCTLKGGSCKVDGVQKTLRPGEGTEQRTDTYGTSWDATKPAKTTILRLALDLNFLYISTTKRIRLNTNGTLDSDGNLIVLGEYQEKIDDGVWASNGQAVTELAYDYDIEYYTSGHWKDSTTVNVDIRDYFLFDLTLFYTSCAVPTFTQAEALEIKPGQRYEWTLNTNSTLNAATVNGELWASAQIDIAPGTHTVTAGNNLTIVDALTTDAVNICEARWRNGSARLKVVDVITEGSGGGTNEGTITTSSQTIAGTAGTSLSYNLASYVTVSNGQTPTFTLASGQVLPAGLSLSSSGVISGTPEASSSATIRVKVSASNCPDVEMTVTFSIAASTPQGTITVTTNPTIQGVVGTAISTYNLASCVTVSNGQTPSFRWNDVYCPQPPWLTLTTSGTLSGTPTSIPSPTDGKVLVSANKCSNEPNIIITWDIIAAGVITVSDQTIKGTVGTALSSFNLYDLTEVSNSQTPTFAVKSGNTLPAGIDLSPEGVFTGTPSATSSATVVVTITARGCPDKEVSITFNITEAQAGSDDFPVSFTVTESQGLNGQDCLGSYTRTGNTLALDGVNYPVYSFTSASGKVHYIHISKWVYEGAQVVGTSWILDTRTSFTAESPIRVQEVYGTSRLKAGTYEPSSTYWNGDMGAVVVSWEMGGGGLTGGADREATAFGDSGSVLSTSFQAVLQKYTYTGTFTVAGETFPYFTGNGSTPWYLFGGKVNEGHYALYLYKYNPTTSIVAWNMLVATSMNENSTERLLMLGKSGSELGTLTKEDVTGDLPATLLSAAKWWTQYDSGYDGTQVCDTIIWS